MSRTTQIVGFSLLAGLCALPGLAASRDAAIGAHGEVYVAQTGSYKALFPDAAPGAGGNFPVLALDVLKAGGETERILVPGTNDEKVESKPSLVYEDESQTLFLVWENRISEIHSMLSLGAFNGQSWMTPIEITGNPFSPKTAPQITVTRDMSTITGTAKRRTILHLIWEEEMSSGAYNIFYSPIILEDGAFLGWNPTFNLTSLDPSDVAGTTFETSADLVKSPTIQGGRDGRTVVVGLASGERRRLSTVEVDVLPQEFGFLAETTRGVIIDLGSRLYPGNLRGFAEQVRASIIARGGAFQPEVIQTIADRVQTEILNSNKTPLANLAEKTRGVIIDLGAQFSGRGLRGGGGGGINSKLVEIGPQDPPAGAVPAPHLLNFRVVSSRPAPRVGGPEIKLFVSEDGEDQLVAWVEGDRIRYRETTSEGWTDIRETKLGGAIDKNRAFEILEQRVRNR
ncbi:MAG: hypothetical protein ACJ75H_04295 [Thermoanaerobaculia bacterium]